MGDNLSPPCYPWENNVNPGLFAESEMEFKADLGIQSIEILKAFAQKLFNAPRGIRLQQRCIGTYRPTATVIKCTRAPKTWQDQRTLHTSTYISYVHTYGVSTSCWSSENKSLYFHEGFNPLSVNNQTNWLKIKTDLNINACFNCHWFIFSLDSHKMPKHLPNMEQ